VMKSEIAFNDLLKLGNRTVRLFIENTKGVISVNPLITLFSI
jgi:hypothetical protein